MNSVAAYFEESGVLARALPEFSPRPQQVLMAEAIAESIAKRSTLVIEAGTGTGKTFAYLLPTLAEAQKVIVSTGTRALQDQLFHRDLPLLGRAMGRPLRAAVLKGRANYLCLHRLELTEGRSDAGRYAKELNALRRWRSTTVSGDINEVDAIAERSAVWSRVTSTVDNCVGSDCAHYEQCFVVKARRAAAAAELVVVNHHLLLADLAMKESGFEQFLPGADTFVIDEAHQLPDIAGHFFGTRFSTRALEMLFDELDVAALTGADKPLVRAIASARRAIGELRDVPGAKPGRLDYAPLAHRLQSSLDELADALRTVSEAVTARSEESPAMESLSNRVFDRLNDLSKFCDVAAYRGLRWLEVGRVGMSLNVTPLDSAEKLSAMIAARNAAWIFTSATLAVGEDFSYFVDRLGVDPDQTVRLESPFAITDRARLYLAQDLPSPSHGSYTNEVVRHAASVSRLTEGGIFLLFTSYRALNIAADIVRSSSDWGTRRIFVQGDEPRDVLLQRFRADGNAVLLATQTFWEGVDVKGKALTVVVIDKLPFTSPSDPLLRARLQYLEELGENGFTAHQLPLAALALKQGAGRLLRGPEDYGVVVLCDPRVDTKNYGKAFIDALAPMPVTRQLDEVREFIETIET